MHQIRFQCPSTICICCCDAVTREEDLICPHHGLIHEKSNYIIDDAHQISSCSFRRECNVNHNLKSYMQSSPPVLTPPPPPPPCVTCTKNTVLQSVKKSKDEQTVYPVIAGMAIGNPQYRCTQNEALAVASKCPGLESIKPVLERIYGNSRIGSRYFAVPDFTPARAAKGDPLFYPADGSYQVCVLFECVCVAVFKKKKIT